MTYNNANIFKHHSNFTKMLLKIGDYLFRNTEKTIALPTYGFYGDNSSSFWIIIKRGISSSLILYMPRLRTTFDQITNQCDLGLEKSRTRQNTL